MSDIRKKLFEEIDKRIKRKKQVREDVAKRQADVEAYVLQLMNEIDDTMAKTVNTSLNEVIMPRYIRGLENNIQTLDKGATIQVSWYENPEAGVPKRINGILIKWSQQYQAANNCDPEMYVDTTGMLFK